MPNVCLPVGNCRRIADYRESIGTKRLARRGIVRDHKLTVLQPRRGKAGASLRVLLLLLGTAVAGICQAQSMVSLLIDMADGDASVITAAAWNQFGTEFLEISREIPDAENLLTKGIQVGTTMRYVVVTPTRVFAVSRTAEGAVTFQETTWDSALLTDETSVFTKHGIGAKAQGEGTFIRPTENLSTRPRTSAQHTYPDPSSYPLTDCQYTSDAYGSRLTCRSGGRITHETVCTVNPVTYAVNCWSQDY